MSPIYDLVKNRRVYSIEADRTVLEGARFMMSIASARCLFCAMASWWASLLEC